MTTDADAAPVLSYAEPTRPGQPLYSTFAVARSADGGVTLTDRRPASPVTAAALGLLGGVLAAAAVALAAWAALATDQGVGVGVRVAVVILTLATLGCPGAAALIQCRFLARPRVLTITMDAGGLTVRNGSATIGGRSMRLARPGRFRAGMASPDLARLRTSSSLLVGSGLRLSRQVLASVPHDECRWLAGVLNEARAATTGGVP